MFGTRFAPKDVLIGETGWPSEGRQRETAVPSRVNEARFIRGFVSMAEANGWHYNLIEAFDQPWKRANEGAVGGYWGCTMPTGRTRGAGRAGEQPALLAAVVAGQRRADAGHAGAGRAPRPCGRRCCYRCWQRWGRVAWAWGELVRTHARFAGNGGRWRWSH